MAASIFRGWIAAEGVNVEHPPTERVARRHEPTRRSPCRAPTWNAPPGARSTRSPTRSGSSRFTVLYDGVAKLTLGGGGLAASTGVALGCSTCWRPRVTYIEDTGSPPRRSARPARDSLRRRRARTPRRSTRGSASTRDRTAAGPGGASGDDVPHDRGAPPALACSSSPRSAPSSRMSRAWASGS